MRVTVLRADSLTGCQLQAWSAIQQADPALDSPFFRPEFTQAVAAVRDVEVAVLEEGGEPVGFFPFQRRRWGVAKPVGWPLCDFQGVVARRGVTWSAEALLRSCGLRAWDFDHLVPWQQPFGAYHDCTVGSPFLDLSKGFDAYAEQRRLAGSDKVRQTLRKARKLEREVGPVRLEPYTAHPRAFATMLEWKAAQYRRTGAPDLFAFGWVVKVLERLLHREEACGAVLTALYAGDRLAAVELGLRSYGVLHSWFPTYDRSLALYSPGMILMVELAKVAPALGIRRYDLGKGMVDYKVSLMSGATPLAEGSVTTCRLRRLLRRGWERTRLWARASRLGGPARLAGRWTRSLRSWLAFR